MGGGDATLAGGEEAGEGRAGPGKWESGYGERRIGGTQGGEREAGGGGGSRGGGPDSVGGWRVVFYSAQVHK